VTRPAAGGRRRRWGAVAVMVSMALAGMGVVAVLSAVDSADPDASRPEVTMPTRVGYVPYWDQDRALTVVRQNPDLFDEVSPVWYSLDRTGRVILADAEHTTVDRSAVQALQARGIRVIPTVTNLRYGEWDVEVVRAMLHDPTVMSTHIRELVDLAITEGYDGIDIDYEHLRGTDREAYSRFLAELATELHAAGKQLTTAVHAKTSVAGDDERNLAQDYQAIGAAADQVRVMTYDYSWETSPPGPVAPGDWVEEVIAWTVTQIPPDKVVLGIVLLGYNWTDGRGVTVDYQQAQSKAQAHDATVRRADDGSPWFTYRDSGSRHEVWYEDAESVRPKLELVSRYELRGAFFWRLGGEDPNVWPTVRVVLR
jgi:spore germination protein